jgi:hypothetical protein
MDLAPNAELPCRRAHPGQPGNAVAFLLVMHLAIALVTYNTLVRLAPVQLDQARPHRGAHRAG